MRKLLLFFGLFALIGRAFAEVPASIPYQGRLLRADGSPVTGVIAVAFSLFDASKAGSQLWSERHSIGLSDGYYSISLGEMTPLSPALFGRSDVWLEVAIEGSPLTPRRKVGAVPFAMVCGQTVGARGGRNLIDWQPVATRWQNIGGTQATVTLDSADPVEGDSSFKITVPLSTTSGSLVYGDMIPIEPGRRYKGRISAKMAQGSGPFYAGYVAYDAARVELTGNGGATGTWGNFLVNGVTLSSTWQTFTASVSGEGTALNNFPVGTRFIRPLVIVNHGNAGISFVDGFELYEDEGLSVHNYLAHLSNPGDFAGGSSGDWVNMKYTSTNPSSQNTSSSVFQMQADGRLKILKAGSIVIAANADVIVRSDVNYASMMISVNDVNIQQVLAQSAGARYWSQLSANASWYVSAGDIIAIKSIPNRVASMDPDAWSTLSVQWTGRE